MRGKWISVGSVFLLVVLFSSFAALPASSTRFKLGEDIQFRIDDSTTWFWGCCTCADTLVLGWRIVTSTEQVIYSVIHDAPVSSPARGSDRPPVALVVGAGDFIGAAIARRFAQGGYTAALGRRHADKLAPLVAEIEAAGGRAHAFALDARPTAGSWLRVRYLAAQKEAA